MISFLIRVNISVMFFFLISEWFVVNCRLKMEKSHLVKSRMIALTALSVGFSLISSSFGFFYVKVFLNIYKVDENWFQLAQTLFLIWNAVNDPLFAYLQDTTNFRFSRTRRESVLYAAPFFAVSYLVPWFPWVELSSVRHWITGLHLITSLCLWDTMFTYVGLAYCCILQNYPVIIM